ncbi:hypothetical protein niasHT_034766 [Heterodera trifolii]|uniref:Uncharacterized protein n=1 Tax=Heterodera trifolii TaxID=157864 RepID=A0ABD2HWB4_9BILA
MPSKQQMITKCRSNIYELNDAIMAKQNDHKMRTSAKCVYRALAKFANKSEKFPNFPKLDELEFIEENPNYTQLLLTANENLVVNCCEDLDSKVPDLKLLNAG